MEGFDLEAEPDIVIVDVEGFRDGREVQITIARNAEGALSISGPCSAEVRDEITFQVFYVNVSDGLSPAAKVIRYRRSVKRQVGSIDQEPELRIVNGRVQEVIDLSRRVDHCAQMVMHRDADTEIRGLFGERIEQAEKETTIRVSAPRGQHWHRARPEPGCEPHNGHILFERGWRIEIAVHRGTDLQTGVFEESLQLALPFPPLEQPMDMVPLQLDAFEPRTSDVTHGVFDLSRGIYHRRC